MNCARCGLRILPGEAFSTDRGECVALHAPYRCIDRLKQENAALREGIRIGERITISGITVEADCLNGAYTLDFCGYKPEDE